MDTKKPSIDREPLKNIQTMESFGRTFIEALPRHFANLKIPGRQLGNNLRTPPIPAIITAHCEIQETLRQVLFDPITLKAHSHAERAFNAFLAKKQPDTGLLKFLNGWNETHKTTGLVSAKIIMRLAADALSIPAAGIGAYHRVMAHMHEVAKDDFGLGHPGHDGMYSYMALALDAPNWVDVKYAVNECNKFSSFLYATGVADHKAAVDSYEHKKSIINAMMVSVASELWNGREYNFISQYIEQKLTDAKPSLAADMPSLHSAKAYVVGHSGEVENKHGLHALAAAQAYASAINFTFSLSRLKLIMLDYNHRVGEAFRSLYEALTSCDTSTLSQKTNQ